MNVETDKVEAKRLNIIVKVEIGRCCLDMGPRGDQSRDEDPSCR